MMVMTMSMTMIMMVVVVVLVAGEQLGPRSSGNWSM